MPRDGNAYIESLRDGRAVYIDGQRVRDVPDHKAFRNAVRSFAALYDFQAAPENQELATFAVKDGSRRVNRAWQLPTSPAELAERRLAIEAWSRLSFGFLGRSPDHVASTISAMAMGVEAFAVDAVRARAVLGYYDYASHEDIFVAYVIQNPQADKSKTASEQRNVNLVARIVDEDSGGITVRGAKMLGTSAVMADEILAGTIQPLRPGEEAYATSFAVPVNARGVKLLSRKSYEAAVDAAFDYPLSSRFDENDAIVYFDDVKVPWDRVFVHRDVKAAAAQWHHSGVHVYQNYQSQIRLMVKLRFMAGLAKRIAETIGTVDMPPVRGALAWIAVQAAIVEGMVHGMEAAGSRMGRYYHPSARLLYAAQVYEQDMYPKLIHAIRDLAGGGVIMLPSSIKDFANDEIADIIAGTQISPVTDHVGRVKLFRLAWDAIGSEFASRHVQYEMLYSGASYVTQANAFRTFDWQDASLLVDSALAVNDCRIAPSE